MRTVIVVLGMVCAASGDPSGPFTPVHQSFTVKQLDVTNKGLDVVYPSDAGGALFPILSFAHGFTDGGSNVMARYQALMEDIASYGYVVVAPRSCNVGCLGDCKNSPLDPPCFHNFYHQQLAAIDWARSDAAAALPVNKTAGAAVSGHSMGGQASLFSAAYNASSHDIRAAVMLHAFTHTYPPATIPHLVFTGTADTTAPASMAEKIFGATGACATRGLVNKVGATHSEPDPYGPYNPKLATYTVAWLKIYLDRTPQWRGTDFDDMIFGSGADSLCHGGDGDMEECQVLRGG